MQNWVFQVFLILISQFIVISDSQQVYSSFLDRFHQKLSVYIYLFVIFVFFLQFISLVNDISISVGVSECEICLVWFAIILSRILETITPCYAESIMESLIILKTHYAYIIMDIRRDPLEILHWRIFVDGFQPILIQFALVVHLFNREGQGLVEGGCWRDLEIEPGTKLACFYIRVAIFGDC
jgi:hypothetical protein